MKDVKEQDMQMIDRQAAEQMFGSGEVVFVEVLDSESYNDFHIRGAINVPLGNDFERRFRSVVPDTHQPVVVYCMDEDCDASAKAARKLDEVGYDRVYDYAGGKLDWKVAGNPIGP